jgi:hypothetical protein
MADRQERQETELWGRRPRSAAEENRRRRRRGVA